jgi:hypothetical protein
MNNEVREGNKAVGFRCWTCGNVFERMWGETCNGCRNTERRHKETIAAIQSLQPST